jgi:hypothetical protein
MPCDQVILNSVEFTVGNVELTKRAIKEVFGVEAQSSYGQSISFTSLDGQTYRIQDGRLTGGRRTGEKTLGGMADQIKQGVARQAVQQAASRYGWALQKGKQAGKYQLRRRAV